MYTHPGLMAGLVSQYGVNESPEIAWAQLNEAASYTAGMLMAVSKSLPPLVQLPYINGGFDPIATVNPGQDNTISFTLLDNRTSRVTYRLVVDDAGSSNDIISLSSRTVSLGENPDLNSLPRIGVETLTWNGLLASGSDIPPLKDGGHHTLYITGAAALSVASLMLNPVRDEVNTNRPYQCGNYVL